MTSPAHVLTKRDRGQLSREAHAPTVSAADLRALVGGLERLGFDGAALLAAVGLRSQDLNEPDARFHCALHMMIVDRAQRIAPRSNLALHVAVETPPSAFPALGYLIFTSDTVGAGVHQLSRYFRLVGAPVVVSVHDDSDPVRVFVQCPPAPFAEEYTASLAVLHFRQEADSAFHVHSVQFTHHLDDVAEYERVLGTTVHEQAKWSGLEISRDAWQLPLRRRDPVLRSILEQHAADVAARIATSDDVVLTLQRVLALRIVGGDTRIETIGRFVGATPRTLQRRLSGVGLSYHALVDAMRRDTADKLLADATLSIGEVAYLLGYSERAAFHRAFRRWHGTTPQLFRERLRSGTTVAGDSNT